MTAAHQIPVWVEVRDSEGHLLCKYDPDRELLEFVRKRTKVTIVDLKRFRGRHLDEQHKPV